MAVTVPPNLSHSQPLNSELSDSLAHKVLPIHYCGQYTSLDPMTDLDLRGDPRPETVVDGRVVGELGAGGRGRGARAVWLVVTFGGLGRPQRV